MTPRRRPFADGRAANAALAVVYVLAIVAVVLDVVFRAAP